MKTPVSFFWLLLLIGDTELTKCWVLYDIDVKWLPGLTEDSEWQELSRSTSRSYSGSQGSVGITKVYNGPTYMPCINHIVAPVAHWGPRTLKIKSCTWRWYAVASGGHWGRRFMITKQCFYPHKLDLDSFYNADIALQNIAINATINRSLNWPNGLHNTSQ